jgi:hypothetical protein
MFIAPRIIVIDDDPLHLQGLVDGLHRYGTSCLPVHFTGDLAGLRKCPDVRVIFADLHLTEGGAAGGNERHFSTIGGLLEETFAPAGPYVLVLWTRYADQAVGLSNFLETRLQNVSKPLAVVALDKVQHLDLTSGAVKDPVALVRAIESTIHGQPQLAALLRWEERIMDAAAGTSAAILGLTGALTSADERAGELGRLLARLAVEAVGESHVEQDRFGAVNEALLPILADRVAFLRPSAADIAIWKRAFDASTAKAALSLDEAARLNRMLHVDESETVSASVRGSVSPLPGEKRGDAFKETFGLDETRAASEEFGCGAFDPKSEQFQWMLVQTQAACDFAQRQAGTVPYLLALEMPCKTLSKSSKPPAALWRSPPLHLRKETRHLHVSSRFGYQLSPDAAAKTKASYRLREQLLSELLHLAHSQGARPGSIAFWEKKAKT